MKYADVPVVIVTGASKGLGAAVARWLAKARKRLPSFPGPKTDSKMLQERFVHWGESPSYSRQMFPARLSAAVPLN